MTEFRSAILILSVLGAFAAWSSVVENQAVAAQVDDQTPPTPPPAADMEADPAPPAELTPEQLRDLTYDVSNLLATQTEQRNRAIAAERLLAMDVPQAWDGLTRALRSGDPAIIDAVIIALNKAASERAAEILLPAAAEAMGSATPELVDRVAFALIRYGDRIVSRIITLARDRTLTDAARIGAMRTLGIVPSRDSAQTLMAIANPANGESDLLRQTAFNGLRRLSPTDYGTDYAQWRAWWLEAQRKSREEWTAELVQRWFNRAIAVERDATETTRRYVALLRELYLERPLDKQFERLPLDLEDELHQVRLFALDRVGVLVRDSVPIPETVQLKVITCLDHPRADIRRRASSILAELDHPQLPALLTSRLRDERHPTVAQSWLEALALRPHPDALDAVLPWLRTEATSAAAAGALWSLMTRTPPQSTDREILAGLAADAWTSFPSPATARTAALLMPMDQLTAIESLLGGEDLDLARGIAEGLSFRGRYTPLLSNAASSAVYPFAIRAVVQDLPTLDGLRLLLTMTPSEQHLNRWEEALRSLARRLSPDIIADADDLIAATGLASPALRETILNTALLSEEPQPSPVQVGRLLRRLVPLLIEQGTALRSYELIATFGPRAEPEDELDDLRLEVALLTGRFDEAASLSDDPVRWITTLVGIAGVNRDTAAAERLHTEVLRRFGESLGPALRERLDAAAERIAAARNGHRNGT